MLRIIARRTQVKPPVVLEGCRIEPFAIRDRSMRFQGHGLLFRGTTEVGPVPRLALGRDRDNAVYLLHCDARWNVLGSSGGDQNVARPNKERRGSTEASQKPGCSPATRKRRRSGI
jgi:hypothetical protein